MSTASTPEWMNPEPWGATRAPSSRATSEGDKAKSAKAEGGGIGGKSAETGGTNDDDVGGAAPSLSGGSDDASSDAVEQSKRRRATRKGRRTIPIQESPGAAAAQADASQPSRSLSPSKPVRYHKPPRASGRSELGGSGGLPNDRPLPPGRNNDDGGPVLRGLLRGVARLLSGNSDGLRYHNEVYSAQLASPDARNAKEQTKRADRRAGRTHNLTSNENKQQWRVQCMMRASERDTSYVRDMRILYASKAVTRDGGGVVVGVGAHYTKRLVPREDMLLYILKTLSVQPKPSHALPHGGPAIPGLGASAPPPLSIVYLHAGVKLPKKPAVGFFKSLCVALGDGFPDRLRAIYVVHPTPLLRTWILSFAVRVNPEIFRKVVYVRSLRELRAMVPSPELMADIPAHVADHDATGLRG